MKRTMSLVRKELNTYFGSPMALIFVGVFLAATLFAVFWVDTFFSRGIADVRPMFQWMPILLIFLVGALTMRQWSEEEQTGTIEILLTMPARLIQLVWAKFLAAMLLVILALALTIFLPITVSLLGNLDWGPVFGGYLAAVLLASAYVAIGLFVSSRTDNQIVSLILTVVIGGLFYLVGSAGVTDFFGDNVAEILRSIGSGSRFESIQRGVIDIRDLVYYISLTALFLTLNVVSLDSKRWSSGAMTRPYRQGMILAAALVALNVVALNVWLFPLAGARVDITAQKEYSLSQTTRDMLSTLQEPLLIRGYFSERTHPLLAPLVPTVRDMLREYEIASDGKVVVEIVDPLQDPEAEAEANETYGIQPTPLQVADRYGTSVVNAYFDVLVRYGDQSVVLNFRDLVEIQSTRTGVPDVRLRNLEYDLTRAVKKVVYGFQSIDAVLATLDQPAKLTLYATPDTLPGTLQDAMATMQQVAQDIADNSNGKFQFETINVDAPDSPVTRQMLMDNYGLRPIAASLFSDQSYYLHMVLESGGQSQLVYPTGDLSESSIRTAIESALKRSTTGFLKVVGIWMPPDQPQQNMLGQQQPSLKQYNQIIQQLGQDYSVRPVDLSTGQVSTGIDVLLLIAPQGLGDKELYAVDQYLMRGGAVVAAAGNYALSSDPMSGGLGLQPIDGGIQQLLQSYGIDIGDSLVLDVQNEPFPVQVMRDAGGMQVREVQALNYPFFVDIRADGMDTQSAILANLPAVTLQYASPITVDEQKNANREVTELLWSSPGSWLRSDPNIQPDLQAYPELGFPVEGEQAPHLLAVAVRGSFDSYFKGKPSPLDANQGASTDENPLAAQDQPQEPTLGTIDTSPETSRLVVVSSAEYLNDVIFNLSSMLSGDRYLNSLKLAQNAVDWSVEDMDLLSIRSRGTTSRILLPLSKGQESFWEGVNYGLALLGLIVIAVIWQTRRRREKPMELIPVAHEKHGRKEVK